MATFRTTLITGMAAVLLMAGITTHALGQGAPGGVGSFGGESRGVLHMTGTVVCAGCSLEEAQQVQPQANKLYQLTHRQGQIVLEVRQVNNSQRWMSLVWPPRIGVRGQDSLFAQLTAEENLFKEVELTGLLENSRTFDLFAVSIHGLGNNKRARKETASASPVP